ncbi:MAG: serine/threonine-protein kinase [Cyanobacteria bacterium J06632_22]
MSVESLIGLVLNQRYQLQECLGSSPDRRTFLATDRQAIGQRQVVVKLFLFSSEAKWETYKLFEREAETLKSLDHVAIPQHLDAFDVDTPLGKGFALVQTYVPLRSLQEWVETGRRFTEADLVHIATELLTVLDYLHGMQPPVIHRDLKPSNVLMGDRTAHSPGEVYLIDFGSVQTADHGGTRTVVGTYGYMPLEQFGNRAVPASDLYSLGATLIYLATGQHPADLPQQHLKIDFARQAHLSPRLTQWIETLVDPALSHRPKSAAIALQQLKQLATGQPVRFSQAKQSVLERWSRHSIWTTALPQQTALPHPLRSPLKLVDISAVAEQIEIDLPIQQLLTRHRLVFRPRWDHLYQANYWILLALYLGLLYLFPWGNPLLWPQYRWLWVGLGLVVLSWMGQQYNYQQQEQLMGYRLRLETLDDQRYLTLVGLSSQQEIGSRISRAKLTQYVCDPSEVGGYTLSFRFYGSKYRQRHPRSSSSYVADTEKQIKVQLDREDANNLRRILDPWCGDLTPWLNKDGSIKQPPAKRKRKSE